MSGMLDGGKAAYRQWLAEVEYGVRAPDTAPSDVLLGPPAPAPPPPAAPPPAGQRAWRPIGPFSIPHGQTKGGAGDPRLSVSGRVSALAVDPGNAAHLLAGAAGGGMWESSDSGATWAQRTDTMPSLSIGAIAFDPAAPATVYAGTGEGNALGFLGAGLLRSGDGGRTWVVQHAASFMSDGFFDLKVDHENSAHLVAGTQRGLWESTDSGANWTRRRAVTTWTVSFHPATGVAGASQEVFAACRDGLFRSGDGGTTWSNAGLPPPPAAGWRRLAAQHAPSAPDVVWVFGAGNTGAAAGPRVDTGHLLRRGAAGAAFATIPFALPAGGQEQAAYDWALGVAPDNADLLWLGITDLYTATRTPASGAVTVTRISPTPLPAGVGVLHADQHAFAFAPGLPATIYVGNDGGVYRSSDRGARWTSLNRGLGITEFEYIAQHPQVDSWLIGGTQDNGTQRYEGTGTWYHVADGDGGDCAVNEAAPMTVWQERFSVAGRLEIHNFRSRAAGDWETWGFNQVAPPNHPTLFYAPMEAHGHMLVQAGQSVFVSDDEGEQGTFTTATLPALPPPTVDVVSAIAIANEDRIVVGTSSGRLFALQRTGAAPPGAPWAVTALGAAPFAALRVSDLLVAPDDPRRIWATFDGGPASAIARSDDGGTTFLNASGNLPAGLRVYAIAADSANPPTVFVATDRGVYRSTDRGATWTVVGAGIPNCQVKDLLFHPEARVLRAATVSRGVWELEVDLPPAAGADVFIRYHAVDSGRALPAGTLAPVETPNPFTPGAAARWWESPDVKLDAAPLWTPALDPLHVDVFADDHGVAADGLFHENAVPGENARVYVQVHNRSAVDAANVDVRVFFAPASIGMPALPAGFWAAWPANAPAAASAWQPVAASARIPSIEAGRARLASFDWAVPAGLNEPAMLMAAAVPAGGAFAPAQTTVSELLAGSNAIAVANKVAVRPAPGATGPRPGTVRCPVVASAGLGDYALEVDGGSAGMVTGAVLSTGLSNLVGGRGAVPLVEADHPALAALLAANGALAGQLDRTLLYVPPARGTWFPPFALADGASEPLVLVLARPQPPRGRWCVLQRDANAVVRGGLTLVG